MFYNIERTLQILPGVCWAVLGIVLLFLEIKNFKEMVKDSPEAGRGGFIPPSGDGYEYFVDSTRIVYVFQRAKNKFRIYLIQGDAPNVSMKHDKHGQYFQFDLKAQQQPKRLLIIRFIIVLQFLKKMPA